MRSILKYITPNEEHTETNCAQKQQKSGEMSLQSTLSGALGGICTYARDHYLEKQRTATVHIAHNALKTGKCVCIEVT